MFVFLVSHHCSKLSNLFALYNAEQGQNKFAEKFPSAAAGHAPSFICPQPQPKGIAHPS
jgi:hypothetical protein